MNACYTAEMLTGLTDEHVIPLNAKHYLHPFAKSAFESMQQAALQAGFNLQPVSAFRSFQRQQTIWDAKFNGHKTVKDRLNHIIDIHEFNEEARCKTILYWSAMPGASRHHWGSDIDIYDPNLLPTAQQLQLEPWEYSEQGYFAELHQWLVEHQTQFDFYLPYPPTQPNIGYEPWHISYRPLAEACLQKFTPEILLNAWHQYPIAGQGYLSAHILDLCKQYIHFNQG